MSVLLTVNIVSLVCMMVRMTCMHNTVCNVCCCSGIECDLNINNAVGIRNTHLLNAYSCCKLPPLPCVLL